MRTKGCFLIGRAECKSAGGIVINFVPVPCVRMEYYPPITEPHLLDRFASADGFLNWSDLFKFWLSEHGRIESFHGVIIKWEPLP